jgi:hypothetical protein
MRRNARRDAAAVAVGANNEDPTDADGGDLTDFEVNFAKAITRYHTNIVYRTLTSAMSYDHVTFLEYKLMQHIRLGATQMP